MIIMRDNGHIDEKGRVTWSVPPHWDEMERGSYSDIVNHLENGTPPAAHPNTGPGISDKLMAQQNLSGKKGTDAAAEILRDRHKKKE